MEPHALIAEALGFTGGAIAVLAALPALSKALKDHDAPSRDRVPRKLAGLFDGGEAQSRALLAFGNAPLALSMILAGGPKFFTMCAVAAAGLNAWTALVLHADKPRVR